MTLAMIRPSTAKQVQRQRRVRVKVNKALAKKQNKKGDKRHYAGPLVGPVFTGRLSGAPKI